MIDNLYSFSIVELENGEYIGLEIIEILSIPSQLILRESDVDSTDYVQKTKEDFSKLLSELFQDFKSNSYSPVLSFDICIELLWISQTALNQTYNADIRLFLLLRAIDNEKEDLEDALATLKAICVSFLDQHKYDHNTIEFKEFNALIRNVNYNSIRAIVKDKRIESLQNPLLDSCYAFDRFPLSNQDLSNIVNTLIAYPNSAVSVQLIPTRYSNEEKSLIGAMSNILDTINKGVQDKVIGYISNVIAEKHAETYRYYEKNKNAPLFCFNILIYGHRIAVSNISSSIFSQLNAATQSPNVKYLELNDERDLILENFHPFPWAMNEITINSDRNLQSNLQEVNPFYRLSYIITSEEASEIFRLPIGTNNITAGITICESNKTLRKYSNSMVNRGDIILGKLKSSSKRDSIGFNLEDITKHMLVVGSSGYGKTTFLISLLDRLWRDHHIPFLVIEPAKIEYRALIDKIPDLQIFTPGNDYLSPFIFNPFVPPNNVMVGIYKSSLKTAFEAGVIMSSPLDKIFEETVNNCFSDFRWMNHHTVKDGGEIFNFADFLKCFKDTFENIGYTGEARNLLKAGNVRLQSLLHLFDNYNTLPIEDLLTKPTIIELKGIENSDQKALIISLLLININSYINSNYHGTGGLRNVLLLEEAHVLLDYEKQTLHGEANPSDIAKSLIKRLLAEIRSYGVGIIIADQSPKKVSSDVIGLTNTKLSFRLVEKTDKEILANSINMKDSEMERLSSLKTGEAFLFFDKLDRPEEITIDDYRLHESIKITLSDEEIKERSSYWKHRKEMLKPYPECKLIQTCPDTCNYILRNKAREITRRIFSKHFNSEAKDFQELKSVYKAIEKLILAELLSEPYTKELSSCVKLQLLRRVKYETKINLPSKVIADTLNKV